MVAEEFEPSATGDLTEMNCTAIYAITKAKKRRREWIAYNDDPSFSAFRESVNQVLVRNEETPMPDATLYWLWYEAKNFSTNWDRQYNDATARTLILTLARCLIGRGPRKAYGRSLMVMLAWIKRSYPNVTQKFFKVGVQTC